jgi:D-alanyl-D-alanine carboxypeptidase
MNRSPASGASRLSRRAALRGAGATGLALTVSASGQTAGATQNATPLSGQPLPDAIAAVMNQPRYAEYTQWGIYAADRETGEVVYDLNSVQRYVPGSTTKLFRPRQRSPPMDRTSVSRHRSIAGAMSWTGRSMVI